MIKIFATLSAPSLFLSAHNDIICYHHKGARWQCCF